MLTDRGTEYCGQPDRHEYELYLAVENIDHTRTKTKHPQTNGICERFNKTCINEFYRVAFRKKLYHSLEELQADLDVWLQQYNEERTHQGRWCYGKTPMRTFLDSLPLAKEKMLAASAVENELAPLAKLEDDARDARRTRDAVGQKWEAAIAALRRVAGAAADEGAPDLYPTLFPKVTKASKTRRTEEAPTESPPAVTPNAA